MMKNLKVATATGAILLASAFGANAESNSEEILKGLAEGAELATYQYDTVKGFCDDFNVNVVPTLAELGLNKSVKAAFSESDGLTSPFCAISLGDKVVSHTFAEYLEMNEVVNNASVVKDVLSALSRDDLTRVAGALPGLVKQKYN